MLPLSNNTYTYFLLDTHTHTFLWWDAGSDTRGPPPWRLYLGLWSNNRDWEDSGREEREVGVREEEDNRSQLRLERGDPRLICDNR